MDPTLMMTSGDLDEFNSFLDTWMQDVPGAEQNVRLPQSLNQSSFPPQLPELNTQLNAFPFSTESMQGFFPEPDMRLSTASLNSSASQGFNDELNMMPEKSSSGGDVQQSGEMKGNPKKAKVLEKNRKAQKRFRDKQKMKMTEMQVQLETLQRNLEAVSLEKTSYLRQNEVLNKVLELRQSQINVLTETARITNTAEELAEQQQADRVASTICPGVSGLSVDQIRALSGKDAIIKWRTCVQEMAAVLTPGDAPGASPEALEALEAAARKGCCFAHTLSIVNPNAVKVLIMSNLETLNPDEERAKDTVFWTKVCDSLELTDEQKDKVVMQARMLKTAIFSSDTERQQLAKELHELLPSTCGTEGNLSSCIRSNELIARLRKNFHQEHEAWCNFTASVLGTILNARQQARYCVNAFPMFPNSLQLAKHVANCDGTPCSAAYDKEAPAVGLSALPQCTPYK